MPMPNTNLPSMSHLCHEARLRLRQLREAMGLSRPKFAEMLGIPPTTLLNYELGYPMSNQQIEIARAELLLQQRRFDYWCKSLRHDERRLRTLQKELLSLRRNRYTIGYPEVDLPNLLTRCRCARATRNHAANVSEIYRIRCRQLLDITGIPQVRVR